MKKHTLILLIMVFVLGVGNLFGQTQNKIEKDNNKLTFTVNSTDDTSDISPGDGICDDGTGNCTLRAAIEEANASYGDDVIAFDIPGTAPYTFQPNYQYPVIYEPVVIDGTTEPDFEGTPVIELDGSNAGNATGINIIAGNSIIRGLAINHFLDNGITLNDNGNNTIESNFIGTDVTGTVSLGNGNAGIMVGSPNNTIGGTTEEARNIISGNLEGVTFPDDYNATQNTVIGNYIGTDVSGTFALGNNHGLLILGPLNTIGGVEEYARNLISGNTYSGIGIASVGGVNADNNVIQGNYIGTDVTGTNIIMNGTGITIGQGSSNNIIGGTEPGSGNLISGNDNMGIHISDIGTNGNTVLGNYLGTDVTGTNIIMNGTGITIGQGSSNNIIGGTEPGSGNLISGNDNMGIYISNIGSNGNTILGNYIGTDNSGINSLPNAYDGISIMEGAANNIIGGQEPGTGNVISGNGRYGINIGMLGTNGNLIMGNYIGTDLTGSVEMGNGRDGVCVWGDAKDNLVGGDVDGTGNIIAFNIGGGILISNTDGTIQNRISRNSIFSNNGIGIDLSTETLTPYRDGITPNDQSDPDSGPNNLQNFPEISVLEIDDNDDLWVNYYVDSDPSNSSYPIFIQFFKADSDGEGQKYLLTDTFSEPDYITGIKSVNIGNAIELGISNGDVIVATATDDNGNTSEFSSTATTGIDESYPNLNQNILFYNYPNPFSDNTIFNYYVEAKSHIKLSIHNLNGQLISMLVNEVQLKGEQRVIFDRIFLPQGIYFCTLKTSDGIQTTKIIKL